VTDGGWPAGDKGSVISVAVAVSADCSARHSRRTNMDWRPGSEFASAYPADNRGLNMEDRSGVWRGYVHVAIGPIEPKDQPKVDPREFEDVERDAAR
jgi:hypothetical protein